MSVTTKFIQIGSTTLPTPDVCRITEYSIDSASTGRGENAELHRERLREKVASIDLTWNKLTALQARAVREALSPAEFQCTFWFLGQEETRTMYAGDINYEPNFNRNDTAADGGERWTITTQLSEY